MGAYRALDEGQVLLGKYRIEQQLGEGGMAVIYRAVSLGAQGFQRPVVIKVIKPHLAQTPGMVEQFVREASVGAALDHPNIVNVFDLGESEGMLLMVMEYVQGKDLSALIHRARKARRVLSPEMVAFICVDICAALECSHGHVDDQANPSPIIHRDISPQNILVSRDGHIKLADFGMARALGTTRQTTEGVVKGKLSYMSPEQSRGVDVDARSDLFSLGVVMWEALTGRRLFLGKTPLDTIRAVRACAIPPLKEVAPHTPTILAEIVQRLLSKDPKDRPQGATDLRQELIAFLRQARPIDASALSELLESYFPSQDPLAQTAVPELSFADEGDESGESTASFEVDDEDEQEPESEPAGAVSKHTLVMFGAQAEALAATFQAAQAAAAERAGRKSEPPPQGSDERPTQLLEEPSVPLDDTTPSAKPPSEMKTIAFIQADPHAHSSVDEGPTAKKKPPPTMFVAPETSKALEAKIAEPNQGAQPATRKPPATVFAAQVPQQLAQKIAQPQAQPYVQPQPQPQSRPVPYQGPGQAAPQRPPRAASSSRPFVISLLIGVPLGAVVALIVFWLLTR